MTATTLVQLRVPAELLARIDEACGEVTRTAWLLGAAERQLDVIDLPEKTAADSDPRGTKVAGARSIGPGIPCPGVLCSWPACMSRDTDRFAVLDTAELARGYGDEARDEDQAGIALCKHHGAQLEGRVHRAPRRELPPSWRAKSA